jgi:hypothetical protein
MLVGLKALIHIYNSAPSSKAHRSKKSKGRSSAGAAAYRAAGSLDPYLPTINNLLSHIIATLDSTYGSLLLSNQSKSLNGS